MSGEKERGQRFTDAPDEEYTVVDTGEKFTGGGKVIQPTIPLEGLNPKQTPNGGGN
jgi:hypothetical protein